MTMEGVRFTISAVDSFSKTMNKFKKDMTSMSTNAVKGISQLSSTHQTMANELKNAFASTKESMNSFKGDLIEVQHGYLKLAQSSDQYVGKTGEFINAIGALGKKQKSINDQMIANNDAFKMSFFESIGSVIARSTQSEKIAQNFDRMNNPLYKVNNGLLKITQGLEETAKKGQPAYLALKQLGPNASLKQLNDHVKLINQGLTRFPMVAMAAGVASIVLYGALHKAAGAIPGYTKSFETMKDTMRKAFQPMVEVFAAVMTKVYDFITVIGKMMIKFNEAHPTIAKILQAFLMLLPALTLILAPLAIGIGLFGGLKAAFAATWMVIGPLITGLGAMMGTVILVAAAIVGFVAAFVIAYKKIDWFRNAVDAAWAWIKQAFTTALNAIKDVVTKVFNAVVGFIFIQLTKIKAWWAQHGDEVMALVKKFMSYIGDNIKSSMDFIKGVFQIVWPIIKNAVKVAWEAIKTIVDTGIDLILGFIEVGMKLLEGDWKGAWESIKRIASDIWQNIESFFENIDLYQIGKDILQGLIDGIGSMGGAIQRKIESMASLIPEWAKQILGVHSPSRVMMEIGGFTAEGMAVGLMNGLKGVKKAAGNIALGAVSVPKPQSVNVSRDRSSSASSKNVTQNVTVNLEYHGGSGDQNDAQTFLRTVSEGLANELQRQARISGIKL
ncbi:phage tail protein [Metabacillus sp. Hm71]|uniref:phage tail protein n=1 Tax=Metabacillus sp. Hm71 TaxID=3450743 RepID=UPI003F41C347